MAVAPTAVPRRARSTSEVFLAMAPLVQTRVVTLAEAPGVVDFLFLRDAGDRRRRVGEGDGGAGAAAVLADAIAAYEALAEWTPSR